MNIELKTIKVLSLFIIITCFTLCTICADEPAPSRSDEGTATEAAGVTLPERGVCAHRGALSLFPENTLPAFVEAVRLGAAMIEFDVRFTKDRRLVILHDFSVDRTSDGKGKIFDLTFDEVRALDFGAWKGERFAGTTIPTLDETLAVFPRTVWLNVHLSQPPKTPESLQRELALATAERIVAAGRENQAFMACNRVMAEAVGEKYPQIKICNMERQDNGNGYIGATIERKCAFIQMTGKNPTPEQIARLKSAGVKVNFFGVKDAAHAETLFKLGVDFPLFDDVPMGLAVYEKIQND